jgi:hypothetical protein
MLLVPKPWLIADAASSTRESSSTASAAVTLNTSRSLSADVDPTPSGKIGADSSAARSAPSLVSPPSDRRTMPATVLPR